MYASRMFSNTPVSAIKEREDDVAKTPVGDVGTNRANHALGLSNASCKRFKCMKHEIRVLCGLLWHVRLRGCVRVFIIEDAASVTKHAHETAAGRRERRPEAQPRGASDAAMRGSNMLNSNPTTRKSGQGSPPVSIGSISSS